MEILVKKTNGAGRFHIFNSFFLTKILEDPAGAMKFILRQDSQGPARLAVGNNVALVRPAVPQQKNPDGSYNGTECGAFTLTFLEHFMAANPEDISEGSSGRPSASAVATHAVATRLDTDPGLFLTDKWFSAEEASAIRGHLRRLFGEMFLHQLRKANAGAAAEKLQGLLAAANKHCKPYKHVLLKAMRK
ncbi:hypothetical protein GPECTOR_17g996 [Gonium pectorale]|uniref:Ubiquitin-like protease family profile domain-containing protein n=1 Tax=Gonium pectorale TaxID=33097 RepID=A0A150GKU9_GONPE|nr:hypothetical protein GPECTOR_17g996 [Gonium pectorale]|eukprot:KXZ50355.1 hypothetical protein GPECTOR_17g996 [Gonium pectorale]